MEVMEQKRKPLRTEGCFMRHDSVQIRSLLGASIPFRSAEVIAVPTEVIAKHVFVF
jgi:hypothetical protein